MSVITKRPFRQTCGRAIAVAVVTIAIAGATPSLAQNESEPGPYVVARAGAQIDADLAQSNPVTGAAPLLPRSIDAKAGLTGELGMGYDLRGLRLEGTIGYNTAPVDGGRLSDEDFIGGGRLKSIDLGVAAYLDLNPDGPLNPFLGGGVGASRVHGSVVRVQRLLPGGSPDSLSTRQIDGSDWGLRWHLDAGAAYSVGARTAFELSGRYSRTSGLDLPGTNRESSGAIGRDGYDSRVSTVSVLVGIRQKF